MDDEHFYRIHPTPESTFYQHPFMPFIQKICNRRKTNILEHESRTLLNNIIEQCSGTIIIQINVIQEYNIIGISCYTICLNLNSKIQIRANIYNNTYTDYIRNIPYIPQSVLDTIQLLEIKKKDLCKSVPLPEEWIENMLSILAKFKQKIMDKFNEDPTYQELCQFNIVHEIQQLKIKNEKTKQKYKTKLSDMKSSIQQLQEDMRQMSMVNVGKKYGVSDNAIRKWKKYYEKK